MEMEITFPGGKRVDASFGEFTIKTDQGIAGGGLDSAPNPFNYFLASMGTCAGVFVLSYCSNRGIPTDGIKLIQRSVADPNLRMIGEVEIEIVLPVDFPEKHEKAVVRAAGLCAVKKHIAQGLPKFNVTSVRKTD